MKVFLSNAYSPLNFGDAAIISSMIEEIERVFPGAEVMVSTMDETDGETRYAGVYNQITSPFYEAVYRSTSAVSRMARTLGVIIFPMIWICMKRLGISVGSRLLMKHLSRFLVALSASDVVIAAGGGYLLTNGTLRSLVGLFLHLHTFWIAKALKKPVFLYAQSVGPFSSPMHRALVRLYLNKVDMVIAREDISLDCLKQIGVRSDIIRRAGDVAFLFQTKCRDEMGEYLRGKGLDSDVQLICITARKCLPEGQQEDYEKSMSEFSDQLVGLGFQVVFVPQCISQLHNDDDRAVESRIVNRMKNADSDRVVLLQDQLNHWQTKAIYEYADYMIATRMHSAIFALTAFVPTLAIAYEYKTTGIMDDLGLHDWVIPVEDVNETSLQTTFKSVVDTADARRGAITERIAEYCRQARLSADYIAEEYRKQSSEG